MTEEGPRPEEPADPNAPDPPLTLRDVEHLLRIAGLFAAGFVVFVVLRALLVPASFGQYGHYRGAALTEISSKPVVYAGRKACVECHDDVAAAWKAGHHKTVGCESCHGAHGAHAEDPGKTAGVKPDPKVVCARCHAALAARGKFPQVKIAEHAGTDSCTGCHAAHDPLGEAPPAPAASPKPAAATPGAKS